MARYRQMMEVSQSCIDATCDTILLGRLGRELARVYQDSLNAPVPGRLQMLIDQIGDERHPARETVEESDRS